MRTVPEAPPIVDLQAKYDQLLAHMARFNVVQQELIRTRDRLDQELARVAALHRYNTQAISVKADDAFAELTAETVIDVFESEFGGLWRVFSGDRVSERPAALVGADAHLISEDAIRDLWALLRKERKDVMALPAAHPLRTDGDIEQMFLASCRGPDGRAVGLLVGGITREQADFYDPLPEDNLQALRLMAQQVGALLQNRNDQRVIRNQLETIQLSEERLAQALDGGEMGLWDWDIPSSYVFFSARWMEMLGYSAHELPHSLQTWEELMHPEDLPIAKERIRAYFEGESAAYVLEHRLRSKTGDWRWILARGKVLRDALHAPKRMVGVHVDVTERRANEDALQVALAAQAQARSEAEEANRAKSDFLATMSHEIRTPMNGVVGMLQLLRDTPLSDEQRGFTSAAYDSALVLLTIIDDILDLSKIEAGKLHLEVLPFSPRKVVADVVQLLQSRVHGRNVRFLVDVGADVPDAVLGDSIRFRQVVTNLIGNAVKFTALGEIRVQVTHRGVGATERLQVAVQDTGIGIAAEALARLFQPFTQADASTTRRFGGTGLGLAICHRLVTQMGGQIDVSSEVGVGSTFRFDIVAPRAEATTEKLATAPIFAPDALLEQHCRVLVVEDSPINQLVTRKMLEKLGVEVVVSGDGQDAVERLEHNDFDLILMDLHMPILDGMDATRILRERERARNVTRVPVIALTASAMPENRIACLEAGMDDFLTKPVQGSALVDTLNRWLSAKR